ncbi:hypothetical protein [Spirochaeta africana]|uniref:Uncharacterized protein n=1 Tax=Spirochaeta africana (strain ATCC 700263 / DSM 8902 / Z-7692) TaxID=889378 RepID=H9ULI0_SPIAZ|nr:hypothetical protein [Spirochaeta africana]AFG38373.1 hypothetical protein Spiaf_2341 [Spirochaeta africana DSM 8902]
MNKLLHMTAGMVLGIGLLGCAGMPRPHWRAEADLPQPTVVAIDAEGRGRWELPLLGSPVLTGEWEETPQGRVLHIDSLQLFLNWQQGWTEVEYMAGGAVRWSPEAGGWRAEVLEPVELVGVERAAIRRQEQRLRGDRAWEEARRRSERIAEIAVLARDQLPPRLMAHDRPNYPWHVLRARENFQQLWGHTFFPEVYGWREYRDVAAVDRHAPTERGEDIAWNRSVTGYLLPEAYADLRNSGTLFRDFEEGLEWIYMVWVWDLFFQEILPQLQFYEYS